MKQPSFGRSVEEAAHAQSSSCHAGRCGYIDSEGEGLAGKTHWSWLRFKFFHMKGSNWFDYTHLHTITSIYEKSKTKYFTPRELFRFKPVSNRPNGIKQTDEIKSLTWSHSSHLLLDFSSGLRCVSLCRLRSGAPETVESESEEAWVGIMTEMERLCFPDIRRTLWAPPVPAVTTTMLCGCLV